MQTPAPKTENTDTIPPPPISQKRNEQLKLLYVINHMDWFWSHRLPLAEGAQADGWDVQVACTGAASDAELSKRKFSGLELPAGNILKTLLATRRVLKTTRPDLVHAITLKYAFITGLAAIGLNKKNKQNIKIVHTIAGLGYLFSGEGLKPKVLRTLISPFLKLALRNAQLIFQNPDDQALLIASGFARVDQCHLIRGSGVDVQQFTPAPEPVDTRPCVVMPTRLVHEKGVAIFVQAARILRSRGVDADFQIAGGVSTTNPNAITKTEMEDMVKDGAATWLGKVTDMPALFASCNLIAYPSYYREGIPKVLLEAAASGRAIITTDHPGCREAIDDGENGLLVPVKDANATADAIQTILEDKNLRQKMGQASREKAKTEFDVTLIVRQTLQVYTD